MRLFTKETWSYAVLLIILFVIATIAVWNTISYLEDHISGEVPGIAAALIWALTLGFMLIAGAFGLWAVKFSAEAESRRRVGRLIDAMDYLSDGLLAVDRKGRITGSNPVARGLVKSGLEKHELIGNMFTCLSEEDVALLLNAKEPNEVERKLISANASRTLRFRSQPSEDLTLIMISDVTAMEAERLRSRRVARLQLIGQIAGGVAHDFTNLLCGISGHASLLTRTQPGSAGMERSVETITHAAERGIELAGHLLELAQSGISGRSTDMVGKHIITAEEMLRNSLSTDWLVESTIQDQLPAVALTGIQIEQVVLNMGLLAADAMSKAGVLKIIAAKPSENHLFNVGDKFAGVILIASTGLEPPLLKLSATAVPGTEKEAPHVDTTQAPIRSLPGTVTSENVVERTSRESGVIESVIRSILEEAGGKLDCLAGVDGSPLYRVILPHGDVITGEQDMGKLPDELSTYIAHWSVLLAMPRGEHDNLDKRLKELKVQVGRVDNVMSALARIEDGGDLDAMILEKYLLGQETKGLLKAILKLRPSAGLVVLCEDPESEPRELSTDIVFVQERSDPNNILISMIEAKSLAVRRKKQTKMG